MPKDEPPRRVEMYADLLCFLGESEVPTSGITTSIFLSTTLVKVQHKGQVTIPSRLRQHAGIAEGDIVEATFQRGHIVLTPKVVMDRSWFPNADGEYTPAQRRVINARLAKADKEIKSGRTFGPFDNADDMIASIERGLKKRAAGRKKVKQAR